MDVILWSVYVFEKDPTKLITYQFMFCDENVKSSFLSSFELYTVIKTVVTM